MGNDRFKKMVFGEKLPDRDDPKYRKKYEEDVEAGRRFARITKLDVLAARIQRFAERNRGFFLATVFGIILFCFVLNVYRFSRAYKARQESPRGRDEAGGTYPGEAPREFTHHDTNTARRWN